MNKIKDFLAENYFWIVLVLFLGIFMNTCSQTNNNKRLLKQNNQLIQQNNEFLLQLESLKHDFVNKGELDIMLRIEGLKTEKRMIQSTDRRVWDMNRQSEIDRELETEENRLREIKQ